MGQINLIDPEKMEAAAMTLAEAAYETRTSAFEGIADVEGLKFQITLKKLEKPMDYDDEEEEK